ncbi:MAG: hypothetical protein JXA67_05890 [Micromonosporaceae bacterium]|nr:hypothetical protein [Micromonosporaceae bacterium]
MVDPRLSTLDEPGHLSVVEVVGVADDLIAFGHRYWARSCDDDGVEIWCHTLSELYAWEGVPFGRAPVVAAAGVRAVLADERCPACGGPLSLRDRETFERYLDGTAPEHCVDCDHLFVSAVVNQSSAGAARRRARDRERAAHQRAVEAAAEQWVGLVRSG